MGATKKRFEFSIETAKTAFDWTMRLLPALGFLLQVAIHYAVQQDRDAGVKEQTEKKMVELQTAQEELKREVVERKIENGTLRQELEDQKQFYLLTQQQRH